jgi:hypothetical protein
VRIGEHVAKDAVALIAGVVTAPLNALGPSPSVRLEKALVTA